jgi:hypothetical protein
MTHGLATNIPLRRRRRLVVQAAARVLLTMAALVLLYYLLPMDKDRDASPLLLLGVALLVVVALMAFQVRGILQSPLPGLRAVEALAASIPMLALSFATTYFLMSESDPEAFTEPLTRTDALYFAITVFSTVGFGDIAAVTSTARIIVTLHMVVNFVLVGIGIRIVVGAVQIGQQRLAAPPAPPENEGTASSEVS